MSDANELLKAEINDNLASIRRVAGRLAELQKEIDGIAAEVPADPVQLTGRPVSVPRKYEHLYSPRATSSYTVTISVPDFEARGVNEDLDYLIRYYGEKSKAILRAIRSHADFLRLDEKLNG